MKCTIIAHGNFNNLDLLKKECKTSDIIICSDGGAEYAYKCDITPDYLIGDFDSISQELLNYYIKKNIKVEKYPSEKDYTDTELCIKKAVELNCTDISIAGGIGDRIDHSLGNIGLLYQIKASGFNGYVFNDDCKVYLCSDYLTVEGMIGDTISLIPYLGDAVGVSLKGLKYPLNNATIKFGSPIGISNVFADNVCKIEIIKGMLLVIKQNNV